ncbi:antibiotic biosynthesis monooxygenase [Solitalea sp. MAHUQ-68]|uniref:Antibiotic biosynthesis monooxygenase n=1 Tax=Solitalea agri TaxID=2953739 RepID=A0A9X2JGG0_9SPHI|nr:antibiotic biosynthesis monooxygenase family protein [Solitalea agri]MCO4294401.1 antibiotic biosynthesis monooxygenase [Solitalea agri]
MIKRIVKMTFAHDRVNDFLTVFEESKELIRAFKGCEHLELLNDVNTNNRYFTLSFWESEAHLENYRQSELFKSTWAKTKPLFIEKAEAWSVSVKVELL